MHELRHTFVALWVAAGRNIKEVSVAAGHSSVAFTLDRYGHLYELPDDDLQDQLDVQLGSLVADSARTESVVEMSAVQGSPSLTWAFVSGPNGIRTRVTALKGQRPNLARRWGLQAFETTGA